MISKELIRAKGTLELVDELYANDTCSKAELEEAIPLSVGTLKQRLDALKTAGVVKMRAELSEDGKPIRVYTLTSEGDDMASTLDSVLSSASSTEGDVQDEE